MNSKITYIILFFLCVVTQVMAQKAVVGRRTNVVCLVRFVDESPSVFTHSTQEFEALLNDSSSVEAKSLYNYFRHQSHGQFSVVSEFLYDAAQTTILSYQDTHTRKYFEPKTIINREGYDTDFGASQRERELIKDVAKWLDGQLPDGMLLDADSNGSVDNLFLIVSGMQSENSVILYPHQGLQMLIVNNIKGKMVGSYTILFDDPFDLGTTCHEFMHTLGAPDLYLSNKSLPRPMGTWDLMATNGLSPQGMSAYTRYRYGGWLPKPVELTESGYYELNPLILSSSESMWYKIQEPERDEFFVMEYRTRSDVFDKTLPSSGLLVYRINPAKTGNNSSNGTTSPYGQYLFRSGGTSTAEGTLLFAALSSETGRTSFAKGQTIYPFYSDGSMAQFEVTEVGSSSADKMRFYFKNITTNVSTIKEQSLRCIVDVEGKLLTVTAPSAIVLVELYDMNGRRVGRYTSPLEQPLSLSPLQRGTYIVRVGTIDNEYYNNKIIF